jgi:hypothetical protein
LIFVVAEQTELAAQHLTILPQIPERFFVVIPAEPALSEVEWDLLAHFLFCCHPLRKSASAFPVTDAVTFATARPRMYPVPAPNSTKGN